MSNITGRDIIHRWEGNPIISIEDLSFRLSDIHNCGVIKLTDDRILMLITVESLMGYTMIYKAVSDDGINFTVDPHAFMEPSHDNWRKCYETFGVRDPRITKLDNKYYICFVADSGLGYRIGIASTTDFKKIDFLGYATQPDAKNGVLFPCKFDGRYALLKRPLGGAIWVSFSEDLEYWGDEKPVFLPRPGYWDSDRIGISSVPILTDKGWLVIYYGAKETSAGPLFRLGAAVLDSNDPSKVIARSNIPILSPRETYERIGDVPNIVFSCGAVEYHDELNLYYGGSNSCICLGTTSIAELVDFCFACTQVDEYMDWYTEKKSCH